MILVQATTTVLLTVLLLICCPGLTSQEVVNDNTISTANLSRPVRCFGCYDDRNRIGAGRFLDFDWLRRGNYYDRTSTWYRPAAERYAYDDYYRSRVDYPQAYNYNANYRGNGYDNLSPNYDQYRDFGYNNYYRSMDRDRFGYDNYRYYRPYDETYRGSTGFDIKSGKGHYFANAPQQSSSSEHSASPHQFASSPEQQQHEPYHQHHHQQHSHSQASTEHRNQLRDPSPPRSSYDSDSYQNHPIPFDDSEAHSSEHGHSQDSNDINEKKDSQYPSSGAPDQFDHIHVQQLPDLHIANRFNNNEEESSSTTSLNNE